MFLEGEVDWILVLGLLAGVTTGIALVSLWVAVTGSVRYMRTSGELDLVQKVAVSADRRLFETLDAIPVALVETDMQGRFVFANRAAHHLLGRRDAELIGLRFHSATWGITYPDGRTIPPELLPSARALRGQTVRGFQHIMANPATRRKMLVSVTAMPIEDEHGRVTGSTAAIVETEGLTTPGVELESPPITPAPIDSLSRRVFEAASTALVVVSPEGAVLQANRTALGRIGRGEDAVGADFADLFLIAPDRGEGRQALRAALDAGPGAAEPLLASDMCWRILALTDAGGRADALLLEGEPVMAAQAPAELTPATDVPVADDPSRAVDALRRELDDARADARTSYGELERVAAAARADADSFRRRIETNRLAGAEAQDFHALLGVMTSALDMMLKQADDPARVRRLGQAALTAGQRGEAMTRRLVALSAAGNGHDRHPDHPWPETLDAGVLLRGMESRLKDEAGSGVDLMIETPSSPAPVRLDPVGFEGAVRALVANAVDAVSGTGSVAVRLTAGDTVRLSVRDSGPGMDDGVLARAEQPFFTTRPGSAGLGLAQARAFAVQTGGSLSIDSAPGDGAETTIILPTLTAGNTEAKASRARGSDAPDLAAS